MSTPALSPILIIGGGIVGLTLSLVLTHHSIPHILFECRSTTSIHPRARSVNARTVELFRHLSIASRVITAGKSLNASMGIYSGTSLHEVIEPQARTEVPRKFPFAGLAKGIGPESGTFITQDLLEPVLLDVARERGGNIRFSTECLSVTQDLTSVTATVKDRKTGEISSIQAKYLVAADGGKSPIRTSLGIETIGRGTLGHLLNIFFTADLSSLVKGREFSLCMIERTEFSGLLTAINNNDKWVFHLLYDPTKGENPADLTEGRCIEILKLAVGIADLSIDIKSIIPWESCVNIAENF